MAPRGLLTVWYTESTKKAVFCWKVFISLRNKLT